MNQHDLHMFHYELEIQTLHITVVNKPVDNFKSHTHKYLDQHPMQNKGSESNREPFKEVAKNIFLSILLKSWQCWSV